MARAGLGAEWRCLYANDFDPKKARAYNSNWGSHEFHLGDIADVSVTDLKGSADLMWGSFPCQDLSLAGSGGGLNSARSGTFWHFERLLAELVRENRGPKIVAIENVCGALSSNNGRDFASLCSAFVTNGYKVGALVIDASHFVPQSRPRLFVFAVSHHVDLPSAIVS